MQKIVVKPKTVICGFPGVGKSHLRQQYPGQITDLDSSTYSWLTPSTRNHDFPKNYVDAIQRSSGVVLVSSHKDVRECLAHRRIPFVLCYPRMDAKWEYLERYRQRGSPETFVRLMDIMWMEWVEQVRQERRCTQSIELMLGKYLADVIQLI